MASVSRTREIGPPAKLSAAHDLSAFDSGEPVLDDWLRRRALQNEESGPSRTYVVCAGTKVVGYYSLAVGAIAHAEALGKAPRNMPNPVPAVILGRLAIDKKCQGAGIGTALLRDAILRTIHAADIAGIRVILVHAISETAKRFYEKHGFIASPVDHMMVMITVAEAIKILDGKK